MNFEIVLEHALRFGLVLDHVMRLINDRSRHTRSRDQAPVACKSSDQGQILDDQGLDPGRRRIHRVILGDPPLSGRPGRANFFLDAVST